MPGLGISSRAIIGRFYQTLEGEFAGSWASRLGMLFDSNQESETYKWLGATPAMREWTTGRLPKGLRSSGITIENKTFESTLEIDVDDLRRDKTSQILLRVDELAARARQHWEKLLSTLIANGTGDTSGLCYDGQYFFDDDHSEGSSGTLKNLLTATEVTQLDVATATAPTESEMALAILGVIGHLFSFKDDQGEPTNGDARRFLVMVPVPLWGPALSAARARLLQAASGTVRDNPLQNTDFNIEVVCNPRLTWTANFAVFRTDGRAKPFILQEEQPIEMSAIAEGSEEEFKNRKHLYGVTAIRNAGYGMWQHAAHATLS